VSFSIGCVESQRGTRVDQHNVARLPVGNIDRRDTNCAGFIALARVTGLAPGEEEAFHDVLAAANVATSIAHRMSWAESAPGGVRHRTSGVTLTLFAAH
jgi:hypothetical protein